MARIHSPVLIIGSGPAGWTAAIYAARAQLKPVIITGLQAGGQLTITADIENYPGFAEPVGGPWLMEQMAAQAEKAGAAVHYDSIIKADLSSRPFTLTADSGDIYSGDSLIIATGAQARWLGLPSEQKFIGGGVSACATCDGFFYKGQDVIVVGGGNSAVEEALYLANIAKNVALIHRRDSLRAEKILQQRLAACANISCVWNSAVEEILGDDNPQTGGGTVRAARVKNLLTGEVRDIAAQGIFIAIGHSPATELFAEQLKLKPGGYIWTEADSTAASVKGVFAAGDVADDVFRQAITAAGRGCMAALEAERFLGESSLLQTPRRDKQGS